MLDSNNEIDLSGNATRSTWGGPEYQGGRVYPVSPEAHAKLRAHWQSKRRGSEPRPAATKLARALEKRRQAREDRNNMTTTGTGLRTQLEPQELAWLELLLRADADDEALAEYRKSLGVHHKTFEAAVKSVQRQISASKRPSAMAEQMQQMLDAAEEAQGGAPAEEEIVPPLAQVAEWATVDEGAPPAPAGDEAILFSVPAGSRLVAPAKPAEVVAQPKTAGLDQVVEWLGRIRAMRDELAELGVTVEGSLRISIDL